MDVRLKHVVAVARAGSFTAAARTIGVTQSAVTRGVADLERQLGYDLFHRTAKGALLTGPGRTFADRAARLLDDERELLAADSANRDPFRGVLRVGVCPAILEWALTAAVVWLKARHPAMRFEIAGGPVDRMAPMLRDGGLDLLVGFDEALRAWSDFKRHPLWTLESALFVRAGHPLLAEERVTPEALSRFEIVSPSDSLPYGVLIRALYESRGVEWRKRVHVADYFPLVRRLVAGSDAVGVVAASHVGSWWFRSRFAVLPGIELCGPTLVSCARRRNWHQSAMARAFVAAMRAHAETAPVRDDAN